jgi:hypothetical protein
MWNVTVDEIDFVDSDSFDVTKINLNVKVIFINHICSHLIIFKLQCFLKCMGTQFELVIFKKQTYYWDQDHFKPFSLPSTLWLELVS